MRVTNIFQECAATYDDFKKYRALKVAVKAQDVQGVGDILATVSQPDKWSYKRKSKLFSLAMNTDNPDVFAILYEVLEKGNGYALFYGRAQHKSSRVYPAKDFLLLPSYLYVALEERRHKIAAYLASHKNAAVEFKGHMFGEQLRYILPSEDFSTFPAPLTLAQQNGCVAAEIAISRRIEGLLPARQQAQADAKRAEAGKLLDEAAKLQKQAEELRRRAESPGPR